MSACVPLQYRTCLYSTVQYSKEHVCTVPVAGAANIARDFVSFSVLNSHTINNIDFCRGSSPVVNISSVMFTASEVLTR